MKKRRNWHRHDYSEIDDGSKVQYNIEIVLFIQMELFITCLLTCSWCNNEIFKIYFFDFPGCSGRDCCIYQRVKNQEIQVSENNSNFNTIYLL